MADTTNGGERMLRSLADRLLNLDSKIEENSHLSEDEARQFILSKRNPATLAKTKSDIKKVSEWFRKDGEDRQIEDIPPKELDVLLSRFLLSVKKARSTGEFEPTTLRGILGSVKRHLTEKEYEADVIGGKEFRLTRETLKAKGMDLKEKGLGNKKNRADPFTPQELTILREKQLLGNASPRALTNTIWLNNTLHLGLRGRQEHLTMLWGDVELSKTPDGVQFLSFTERATKTRKGIDSDPRQYNPKIFEQPGDPSCPVQAYLVYKEKRPSQMSSPDSRFYVAMNPNYGKKGYITDHWFINQPLGKNTLGSLAKRMSTDAGFEARHVNHSGRKTCVTRLLDAGCFPTEVAQLTGHKNLMSLNHYHTVNIDRQKQMSSILHEQATSTADNNCDFNDMSDDALVLASQEIENALSQINHYEEVPKCSSERKVSNVFDMPMHQNSSGSSEEVEQFSDIKDYEVIPQCSQEHRVSNVIDLPIQQSPGGSIHLQKIMQDKTQALFQGCTFNAPLNIVFRQ